ncbi:MAG TPA: DUF2169 domain-containing protein, partial [Acidimicrobiales bacterium]|nr:DUF2169 domain-containing protein [Acidimicrobiales bacterium]
MPDRHGVDTVFAVVKATFDLATGTPRVADEQVPIAAADVHHGDPATSSIRVPSDFSLGKPGTDALMHGTAWAPRDHPVTALDVTLRAGPLARTVRVFGDRHW